MAKKKPKYVLCKLNDKDGLMTALKKDRWYIEYKILDTKTNKLKRKKNYAINQIDNRAERYQEARLIMAKIDQLLQEETVVVEPPKTIHIHELLRMMLDIKKNEIRPRSFDSYSSSAERFIKTMPNKNLTNVKVLDFLKFRDILCKKMKNVSANGVLAGISTLLNEAVKREYLEKNPCKGIKKLKTEITYRHQAIPLESQIAILSRAKEDANLYFSCRMMYYCFIRPKEMRELKVGCIDLNNNLIFVPASASKNSKARNCELVPTFCTELRDFVAGKQPNDFLFSKDGGTTALYKNQLYNEHRKILDFLELDNHYTYYSWKHTGVTAAYKNGADMYSIMRQCGHHSITQTEVYLKSLNLIRNTSIVRHMPLLPA